MTRPALPMPDWATDDTYTSGPDNTLPTKLQPIAGEFSQGWVRTGRLPARKFNWLMNKFGAWTEYFAAYMLDGGQGGSYAPLFPIVIGGCPFSLQVTQGLSVIGGMNVFGANQFHDAAAFSSAVTMASSLNVAGSAVFASSVDVGGFATFSSLANFIGPISAGGSTFLQDVTANGPAALNSTLDVTGAATFHGPVTITGANMTSDANCSLTDLDVFGSAKFHKGVTNRVATVGDTNITAQPDSTDYLLLPGNTILSANRVWTAGDSGAVDGMVMEFSRILETSTFIITVKRTDASVICSLSPTTFTSCKLLRTSGAWQVINLGKNVA